MPFTDRFNIQPVDHSKSDEVQHVIDHKTKPLGSLGQVEDIARQVALIQGSTSPSAESCELLIFAADHGSAAAGVSAYPQEVTRQMVLNFLDGGAAANVFAAQSEVTLRVIDAGVAGEPIQHDRLISKRIDAGTRSFIDEPAMTVAQVSQSLESGAELGADVPCDFVAFGEMGIGNTSSAALIAHKLFSAPLDCLVGRGTGLDDNGLAHKLVLLEQASQRADVSSAVDVLREYGGFEINMMAGAMIGAASKGCCILIDGYIATAAFMAAHRIQPNLLDYAIFCHRSAESGHQVMLECLGVEPLLDLDLRLGEGTGALLAWPIIRSAVHMLNDMASFESSGVSNKS